MLRRVGKGCLQLHPSRVTRRSRPSAQPYTNVVRRLTCAHNAFKPAILPAATHLLLMEGIRFRSNSHARVSKHKYDWACHLLTPSVYPRHTAQTGEHQSINVGSIQQTHAPFSNCYIVYTSLLISHPRASTHATARRVSLEIRQ